ncbi:MAG: transglycosylase SLT domain-containing protein [Pseudomonadota bacterium]
MPAPANSFLTNVLAPQNANQGLGGVAGAIKNAAEATGTDFDFLYKVAARESSLNPEAKAKTSSATGLFQFIEQTWLGAVKKYGAEHGMGPAASAVKEKPGGGYTVEPASARQSVLDLRLDAGKSSALAGELAAENKRYLEGRLGRPVKGAELYAAHFLGPGGAAKLLSAKPDAKAATLLPQAASANRPVFYDGGKEKTVADIVESFEKTVGETAAILRKDKPLRAGRNQMSTPAFSGALASVAGAAPSIAHTTSSRPAAREALRDAPSSSPAPSPQRASEPNFSIVGEARGGARLSAADVEALVRRYNGVQGFSPLAAMVVQWIDPTTMRGGR